MTSNNSKQPFTNARLHAVQAIYAKLCGTESWDKVMSQFLLQELGAETISETDGHETYVPVAPMDEGLFTHLVQYVRDNYDTLNQMVEDAFSDKIQKEKVDTTLRAILMTGVAEFLVNATLDAPIIINEYTDIARSFYDGPQTKIVNALLDKVGKKLRSL